jgi:hypothetical protein
MLKTVSSVTNAIGALNYKGTWNASTNTPTITSSVGVKGDYYQVSVAGSTTINGISNWGVGDVIAFNGTTWQRIEGGADLNGVNLSVSGTTTLSGLTASTALALNAGKDVVSVTNTGTGDNVLATSPTMVTPTLGAATATSINKVALTAPATGSTLTIADGKTLTANQSLTLAGTDATTMTFPTTSATIARTDAAQTFTGVQTFASAPNLSSLTASRALALDASANIVSVVNTGSGNNVLATNPVFGQTSAATIRNDVGNVATGVNAARKNTIVRHYPVVSLGTKLIIPFVSQGSENVNTVCRIFGQSAVYNSNVGRGFSINFSVGHINSLANLVSWGGGGNFASIATSGMDVEITFTSAYTGATSNGVFVTIEYMTQRNDFSINVANIAMN